MMKVISGNLSLLWQLTSAFGTSLSIFAFTLILGLPLGIPIALGRMSKCRLIQGPIKLLLLIIRGTPLMLQIIFVYFAPYYLWEFSIGSWRYPAVIVAFTVNYACYFSEIYRGGFESVPIGQHEAAEILGFSRTQSFFHIILPQVVKKILPPMSNEVITLIKDTSLAQAVAVLELFRVAHSAVNARGSLVPIVMAGCFYLLGSYFITLFFNFAERKLSYYR